jgi:hypothetical protein
VIETEGGREAAARATVMSSTNATNNPVGRCDHCVVLGDQILGVSFSQMATQVYEDLPKSWAPKLNYQFEGQHSLQDLAVCLKCYSSNPEDENTTEMT